MLIFALAILQDDMVASTQVAWRKCIMDFAKNASITSERADIIADTALHACETQERNFQYRFAQHILAKSTTIHTKAAADISAATFVRERRETLKKDAMVDISYQRQIDALAAEGRRLRSSR